MILYCFGKETECGELYDSLKYNRKSFQEGKSIWLKNQAVTNKISLTLNWNRLYSVFTILKANFYKVFSYQMTFGYIANLKNLSNVSCDFTKSGVEVTVWSI